MTSYFHMHLLNLGGQQQLLYIYMCYMQRTLQGGVWYSHVQGIVLVCLGCHNNVSNLSDEIYSLQL